MKQISMVLVLCGLLGAGGLAVADEPTKTISIEEIRPGMTGYGLTVFSGFKVERFKVQVIDVIRNFLPKQDLFLVRADHPVLRHTGVVGGMSGSPIYLDGRLAGALAYGWRFSKDAICGITPIKHMTELLRRKPRGPGPEVLPVGGASARGRPLNRETVAAFSRLNRWWKRPFTRAAAPAPGSLLIPVAVPLNVAGFSPEAVVQLKNAFASYGFEPVQGGGTGGAEGPASYEAGGSIGVQLVRGDMSMAGTGTVTWVGGKRVLGFGHRMFNAGEIYVPAVTARVNHTLANLSRSFKIASPARQLGSLVQDRQAGIMVETGRSLRMIPMTVTMRQPGQNRVFRAELAAHHLLTPTLATTVLSSALGEAMADVDHATFKIATRIAVKGYPPVVLEDHLYSATGVVLTATIFSRGLRALREVLSNDFEPALVERLDLTVDVKYVNEAVEITGVRLGSSTVHPGARVNLTVSFRPYGGAEFTRTYPLEIPRTLAGSVLNVEVASGSAVQPDRAPPQNMRQFLEDLQTGYPARSLVISLSTPYQGLKVRGRLLRDLPTSVIDILSTGTQIRSEQSFQNVTREVRGTSLVVAGKKSLRIRVRSEDNR